MVFVKGRFRNHDFGVLFESPGAAATMRYIDTKRFSASLRGRTIADGEKVLVARLAGSQQEQDLTEPVNCNGYGRIRHFRLHQYPGWSADPLPIVPAAHALKQPINSVLRAQIFQLAACNWRCWYCFVDFNRLAADPSLGKYMTAHELVDLFLREEQRASVIDLSGGQPDLVPEWTLWMMQALEQRGLCDEIFLWSDDNLSTEYLWNVLSPTQRSYMARYPKYARVACFKGYDDESFSFNTLASPALFAQQFKIYRRLLADGFDLYAYVTFTNAPHEHVGSRVRIFVDNLQRIHHNLPLRTVPLQIAKFNATDTRMTKRHEDALVFQHAVHQEWCEQVAARYSSAERALLISDVPMRME